MLRKEDYKAIAEIIRQRFGVDEPWRNHPDCSWAIRLFVGELEDYFNRNDPRFDLWHFRKACGF